MKAAPILLILAVILLPPAGAAPGNAVVRVGLSPPEILVDAGFHDQYIVFNGTVSVEDTLDRELDVVMQTLVAYPLAGSCTPDYLVFTGSGSMPFNCTVKITARISNLTSSVFVNAQAHYRTDIVGTNQSLPVQVVVGALPAPKPPVGDFGIVYGSSSIGMMPVIVILAMLVTAGFVLRGVVRRWKRRGKRRSEQENK